MRGGGEHAMIAKELEIALHNAFVAALGKRSAFISTRHLLLAVLEPGSRAADALRSCDVALEPMREKLSRLIDREAQTIPSGKEPNTQPTVAFQKVIQRAILSVQSARRGEVTTADVLLALLDERDIAALLQGVTAADVVNQIGRRREVDEEPSREPELPELTPAEVESAEDLQIVMLNDDRTPMAFVVDLLQQFCSMSREEATEAMFEVHREGKAVLGLYGREAAKAIVKAIREHVGEHGHPLRCVLVIPK